jgi:signal transduction histidine kinase
MAPASYEIWRGQRNRFFSEMSAADHVWFVTTGLVSQLVTFGIFLHARFSMSRVVGVAIAFLLFTMGRHIVMMWALAGSGSGAKTGFGCTPKWKGPLIGRLGDPPGILGRIDPARIDFGFVVINVIAQLYSIAVAVLTGGLSSPAIPMLLLPAIISLLFLGPRPVARRLGLLNILLIGTMLALPGWMSNAHLPSGHYGAALVVNLAWTLMVIHHVYGHIVTVSTRAGEAIGCMREQRLAEAEAQTRRLQSVGAKVAHELKNPLSAIKGLCQLIARTPASDRTTARLAVVDAEIARMETILAEYLSFSRPLEDVRIEVIDLAAISKDVVDVLAGRAAQSDVELTSSPEPLPFHGDSRRLREALINLVANALEATPTGGTVSITCKSQGDGAVLEVRDSGRGITPEHLARMGTSFFTTRANGTGLGVVLAQGVVNQHRGHLQYHSQPGRGTTATIVFPEKLPLGPINAPEAAASAEPAMGPRSSRPSAKTWSRPGSCSSTTAESISTLSAASSSASMAAAVTASDEPAAPAPTAPTAPSALPVA